MNCGEAGTGSGARPVGEARRAGAADADAEPTADEPTDVADAEPSEAEAADAEPSEAEAADAEPTEAEAEDTEPTDPAAGYTGLSDDAGVGDVGNGAGSLAVGLAVAELGDHALVEGEETGPELGLAQTGVRGPLASTPPGALTGLIPGALDDPAGSGAAQSGNAGDGPGLAPPAVATGSDLG